MIIEFDEKAKGFYLDEEGLRYMFMVDTIAKLETLMKDIREEDLPDWAKEYYREIKEFLDSKR